MTGLRLAGESKGVADFFPDSFKPLAAEVSKREAPATLVSYSSGLFEKGYPSRAVKTYKDKEADWVRKDKDLLSAYRKGREHYAVTCGACHQSDGKGLANMAPALAQSDWVLGDDTRRVIGVAVHGLMGPIKVNGEPVVGVPPVMPPHGFMKDEQLADILTYVRNAWGNKGEGISADQISAYRKKESARVTPWTEAELK